MSKEVQIRRGTTAEHIEFVGKQGEVTMDTERNCLVVHDGETAGGHPVAKKSETDALATQLADIEQISVSQASKIESITSASPAVNLPTKHRVLYVSANDESRYRTDFVFPLLGAGILAETTTWGNFARNAYRWVNEFDVLLFFNTEYTKPVLSFLETASAQDVVDALALWKNSGKKFIVITRLQDVNIIKKKADGTDAEIVSASAAMGLVFSSSTKKTGDGPKNITDISNGVLGPESLINRVDLNLKAYTNRRLVPQSGEIALMSTSDGMNTDVLGVYRPGLYCLFTTVGYISGDATAVGEYRYMNLGVAARGLIGNTTPISLANDCVYGRKIAASGYDNDVTKEREAVQPIINAYKNRPVEFGVIEYELGSTDDERDEMIAWYRSRGKNIRLCSHSYSHCSMARGGVVTQTSEEHVIPADGIITLKYCDDVAITSVLVDGMTLTAKTFLEAVTTADYGHNNHGWLKFNLDNVGKTAIVTYTRLKEAREWIGSLDALENEGFANSKSIYLTGGEKSLSSISYLMAREKGIALCDYIGLFMRPHYLLQEGMIDKMPFAAGNTHNSGFYNWEELIRQEGHTRDEIQTTYAPAMLSILKQRHLPFVWYNHDFMFSSTHGNSLWNSTSYNVDWKKATYEETVANAQAALGDWLDLVDAEHPHWMTRSEYCRFHDYTSRYLQYHVEMKDSDVIVYAKNTGDKSIGGLTFRSLSTISNVTLVPTGEMLPVVTHEDEDFFTFDLHAGQTVTVRVALAEV